jgi:hypothetical protein
MGPEGKNMENTPQELSESKKSTEPFKQESTAESTEKSTADEKKKPIRVEIFLMPTYKKPKK